MPLRQCEVCGTEYRYTYSRQRTCGRLCGAILRVRELPPKPPRQPRAPVEKQIPCKNCGTEFTCTRTRKFCTERCADIWHNKQRSTLEVGELTCAECKQTFTQRQGQRGRGRVYCSRKCGKRAARRTSPSYQARNHRQRARRAGVTYTPINAWLIYVRDKWMCGICKQPISKAAMHPDPMSPSLDHIVPFSKGGAHTESNVQASHLICNSLKSDHVSDMDLVSP